MIFVLLYIPGEDTPDLYGPFKNDTEAHAWIDDLEENAGSEFRCIITGAVNPYGGTTTYARKGVNGRDLRIITHDN